MLPAGQERLMGSLMKNEVILYNYVFLGATCDNFGHVQYARVGDGRVAPKKCYRRGKDFHVIRQRD